MVIRTMFAIAAVSALMMPATAFAQQEEHRIGGKAIPADQIAEVQAHCDAMRKGEKTSPVAAAASNKPSTEAAADDVGDKAVDLSDDLWPENSDHINVENISLERCDEGNFELSSN